MRKHFAVQCETFAPEAASMHHVSLRHWPAREEATRISGALETCSQRFPGQARHAREIVKRCSVGRGAAPLVCDSPPDRVR